MASFSLTQDVWTQIIIGGSATVDQYVQVVSGKALISIGSPTPDGTAIDSGSFDDNVLYVPAGVSVYARPTAGVPVAITTGNYGAGQSTAGYQLAASYMASAGIVGAPYVNRGIISLDSAGVATGSILASDTAAINAQTTLIQSLINQATSEGRWLEGSQSYNTNPVVLPIGFRGAGFTLRAPRGMAAGILLQLDDPTNSAWDSAGIRLYDVTLLGNGTQPEQVNVNNAFLLSNAGASATVKADHKIKGLTIRDFTGYGLTRGGRTRRSVLEDIVIYRCGGHGLVDGGGDGDLIRIDVGQCYGDGIRIGGNNITYTDIRSWLSGQSNVTSGSPVGLLTTSDVANVADPTLSVGVRFTSSGRQNVIMGLRTQENSSEGLILEGSGANYASDNEVYGWSTDGDCKADQLNHRLALKAFKANQLRVYGNVGKKNSGFAGGPRQVMDLNDCANVDINLFWDPTNIPNVSASLATVASTVTGRAAINGQVYRDTLRTPRSITTSATATRDDFYAGLIKSGAGAANLTFNTGLGIAVGETMRVIVTGTGAVTFVAGTATVAAVNGSTLVSTAGIADCYVTCIATDSYVVGGSLV